ncbi:hypothetical protein [Mycobacterium aquaticum]|uniref:Lipoprotein n=1 Tax=Mycobacterium aquaticum TaxID=1927124 RepID=A0A1X0ABC9_9MYCO|nr:hypothetical protein [Mycobacterium aquaticum]ORA27367.1 hypothetical protein BST13_30375 [Mycobacterium aquaticum]
MKKIPITVAAANAVATVALAGCSPAPAPQSAAPSSPTVAAPALAPQQIGLEDLPTWVDTVGARDAAASGAPFVFPEREAGGGSAACFTYMRTPSGDIWILNRPDTAPVAGMALSPRRELYGCGDRGFGWSSWEARHGGEQVRTSAPSAPAVSRPEGVPDLAWISNEVDLDAAQRAMKQGHPFMFAVPSAGVTACHSAVLMPTGKLWFLNETGVVPIGGAQLSETMRAYGCRAEGGAR